MSHFFIQNALRESLFFLLFPFMNATGWPILRPTIAQFSLTNHCNSRCSMCDFWKRTDFHNELNLTEIKIALNKIQTFGIDKISYTANGEIFTRKDILDILSLTKDMGINFSINTNGLLITDSIAKRLRDLKPYSIVIGLDTVDDKEYEKIRGIKNGLNRVQQSISILKRNGIRNISIGSVITKDNVAHMLDLAKFAYKEQLSGIRFTAMQFRGFSKNWSSDELQPYRNDDFIKTLEEQILLLHSFQKKYGIVNNLPQYLQKIPDYYKNNKYHPFPCVTGYYILKISPQGEISLCPLCGKSAIIGHIKQNQLTDIWNSDKARKFRTIIRKKQCVHCWLSCHAEANIRFSPKHFLAANIKTATRYLESQNWANLKE